MVFISRKADVFFAALDHVGHRILDLNAVFHIKAVSFKRRTHLHHRGVYKQQRKIQIAQHLCVVIVEYFKADDAGCVLDVERRKTASPETAVLTAERKLHNTWVYIKRHWQLYLLFLLPAVALTLVFKYAPMGGVLIAFQKYNPFRGIWGSEWVGFKNFTRFMSSPDFQRYLINTLKLSVYGLLWGFPIPILLAFLLNRIESKKIKQKLQLVLRSILIQSQPESGMIADIQSTAERAKMAELLKYATIIISSLPLLVMYPFFQKYFDAGIMAGSIKG